MPPGGRCWRALVSAIVNAGPNRRRFRFTATRRESHRNLSGFFVPSVIAMNECDLKPPRSVAATLRLGLPKGRMQDAVFALMSDAGMPVRMTSRSYRPAVSLPDVSVKLLKPQNIIEMLHHGSRDLGFAGADWVAELGREALVELLDTGLDPVRLVAAAPAELLDDGKLPRRHIVVASEYTSLARNWAQKRGIDAEIHRTWGATEVFPLPR